MKLTSLFALVGLLSTALAVPCLRQDLVCEYSDEYSGSYSPLCIDILKRAEETEHTTDTPQSAQNSQGDQKANQEDHDGRDGKWVRWPFGWRWEWNHPRGRHGPSDWLDEDFWR
ncbi:hypothetical protein N7468_009187 [Penicillium chermesinum]|uniref:Uncharacterized protein n=1 Tax=Penicillium chermesinum TaxID=63820 RepID=A0A9W9NJX5_9EURO|nr:uncharacterized protein N7468_009187 [Penicillium chermesinum]KAJ5219983.1 hypothetical protein N7468_009187 [Penicillium chermesinum]